MMYLSKSTPSLIKKTILLVGLFLTGIYFLQAQRNYNYRDYVRCTKIVKDKKGRVLAGGPAKLTFKHLSGPLWVRVKKTSGRARGQVLIFDNGNQRSEVIDFPAGKVNTGIWETIKLEYPSHINILRDIEVKIVNQSVGNTFGYEAELFVKSSGLSLRADKYSGKLKPQRSTDMRAFKSCSGKRLIRVTKSGYGDVRVRILERANNLWVPRNQYTTTIDRNSNMAEIKVELDKIIKVELFNLEPSGNPTVEYRVEAYALSPKL